MFRPIWIIVLKQTAEGTSGGSLLVKLTLLFFPFITFIKLSRL